MWNVCSVSYFARLLLYVCTNQQISGNYGEVRCVKVRITELIWEIFGDFMDLNWISCEFLYLGVEKSFHGEFQEQI